MGLDQYAYSREATGRADYQWRKHPNLHGWMENLWKSRYGTENAEWNSFNGVEVQLDKFDIAKLKVDIMSNDLPETEGFFFGGDSDKHYREQDLEFCEWALKEIADGREVYYDSSW